MSLCQHCTKARNAAATAETFVECECGQCYEPARGAVVKAGRWHCPKITRPKSVETMVEEVLRFSYQLAHLEQPRFAMPSFSRLLQQIGTLGILGTGNSGTKGVWISQPTKTLEPVEWELANVYQRLNEQHQAIVDIVASDARGFLLAPVMIEGVVINPPNYNLHDQKASGCLLEQRLAIAWARYHNKSCFVNWARLALQNNIHPIVTFSLELGSNLLSGVAEEWKKK